MASDLEAGKLSATLGRALRYYDEIASTNTEAMEWALSGAPHGAVVVTDHQTGGRGRWGRPWFSLPGKGLQFSLILRPDLEVERHGILTAALGVAVAETLEDVVGLATTIKWPNDVLLNDKKVAGILVETQTVGSTVAVAVCGIGINVSLERGDLPPDIADRASSLTIESTRPLTDRTTLLARSVERIESRYEDAIRPGDDLRIIDEAARRSSILGHDVTVRVPDGSILEGRATGFDANGGLVVDADGTRHIVVVGEVGQLRAT